MSSKIEYASGDILGNYGCIFLEEIEPHFSPSGKKYRKAKFKCGYCGNIFEAVINDVKRDSPRSCGCYRTISKRQTHMKDVTGQKFNMLTAIEQTPNKAKDNSYIWKFQCDCGEYTYLTISGAKKTKSCGCLLFHSDGENQCENILKKHGIRYIKQYSFQDCVSDKNALLKFDFYLPDYNCCIEIDGRQHFMSISRFGGDEALYQTQKRDEVKNQYCLKNNINLLRLPYDRNNNKITEDRVISELQKIGVTI